MSRSLFSLCISLFAISKPPLLRYIFKKSQTGFCPNLQASRLYSRDHYDLFGKGVPGNMDFRKAWQKEMVGDDFLWTGSEDETDSDNGRSSIEEEIQKVKREAKERSDLIDANDSDELRSVWSSSDEERTLWTGSEGDDDDDIPTEVYPDEEGNKHIDKLFEFEDAPKYRTLAEAMKDDDEPEEMFPGKQARKLAVENALKKLKRGPDGRYINVWEVMSDTAILIGAFENIVSGPEYAELRRGGPRKLNMEFFKDIQAKMRDPNFEFSPELKLKPKSKFVSRKKFQKTVLDVGTGSGILAIWSAQAGAKKVYAVEATKMSEHARELVKANNFEHVVEVIEGSIEDITLPEKVDVIISEWMGYFLLRESMFDSVICARDRWLKPTGVMYPSHARMWMAPIRTGLGDQKMNDFEGSMDDWFAFVNETKAYYGVDMSALTKPFSEEQKKYYLQTSLWNNLHPHQVIGTAAIIKEINCLTATVEEILEVKSTFSSSINVEHTRICGFGGWFDVHFRGRKENPAEEEVELTTAPSIDNGTHWGQQVFLLHPPTRVTEGDSLNVSFVMNRSQGNHRLMEVDLNCDVHKPSGETVPPFRNKFFIE